MCVCKQDTGNVLLVNASLPPPRVSVWCSSYMYVQLIIIKCPPLFQCDVSTMHSSLKCPPTPPLRSVSVWCINYMYVQFKMPPSVSVWCISYVQFIIKRPPTPSECCVQFIKMPPPYPFLVFQCDVLSILQDYRILNNLGIRRLSRD